MRITTHLCLGSNLIPLARWEQPESQPSFFSALIAFEGVKHYHISHTHTHIYISLSLYISIYLPLSLSIHIDGCLLAYNTVVAACEGLGLARVVAPVFICNPSGFPTYLAHGSRLQELALEYLYEADVPTFLIQFIQSKKLGRTLPVLPMASAQKTASVLVVWGLSGCREDFWGIRNTGEYR